MSLGHSGEIIGEIIYQLVASLKLKSSYPIIFQGSMNDLVCTACPAVAKIDWKTSGQKQADFNAQPGALGVDGKILSAGWIHKGQDKTLKIK